MNLDQAKLTFIDEARDLLQSMEEILLAAETSEVDAERVNALFRAAHTIKGSAGLFGLDAIVSFTHTVENVLDRVRNRELSLDAALVGLLLECRDHIARLIEAVQGIESADESQLQPLGEALRARLSGYLGDLAVAGGPIAVADRSGASGQAQAGQLGGVTAETWHLSLRFGPDVFRHGMDPASFVGYLGEVGSLVHVETLVDGMPGAERMDPESCYLGFEIELRSERDKATIESVFDFVRDDCDVRILPPHSRLAEYVALIKELPEDALRLGEILVQSGALTQRELAAALTQQREEEGAQHRKLGEIVVAEKLAPQPAVSAALEKQKQSEERRQLETRLLKVPADKLDKLIDQVGELVIAASSVNSLAQKSHNAAMVEAVSGVSRLVEDIRDSALRLRMVQIGDTFARFPRVVRDVSKELAKEIDLVITGGETELDKSMVERIGDPLMHLVRNAIDHGIESPDQRVAAGKAARGSLRLHASHDSGSVVIEVSDDGKGLDRERIRAKAIERSLIAAEQVLGDADLFRLVLEPGFSTAEQVTNLSGRGVGMDVVKKNIDALHGSIEIHSESGTGTTFRLRLPLTLAIIDGFLVEVDGAYYVIPLDMVVECIELAEGTGARAGGGYVNLRGEVLPFLRLRELFESDFSVARRENIVVVEFAGKRTGLVVDKLLGEFQTVIKPLSRLFARIKGIGGSTILGTGEVALILDVPGLVGIAAQERPSERDASLQRRLEPRT